MSLVIAKQFGDIITILSDTMISDVNEPNDDVIPGQLKTLILTKFLSVSYSGLYKPALKIIRDIKNELNEFKSIEQLLERIVKDAQEYNDELEFIIATHDPNPKLFKISNNSIYKGSQNILDR